MTEPSKDIEEDLVGFMEGLGFKPVTTEKDHRTITRFEHPNPMLQNVSRHLAKHIQIHCSTAENKARISELRSIPTAATTVAGFNAINDRISELEKEV